MAAEGHPFRGFLYVGLMLTAARPKVIEFNVRLGDPEAQVILPLIDEPLLPLLVAAATGGCRSHRAGSARTSCVGVVLASRGYPESSESGRPIHGHRRGRADRREVFHAGTAKRERRARDRRRPGADRRRPRRDFADAIARAYAGVEQIHFDGHAVPAATSDGSARRMESIEHR